MKIVIITRVVQRGGGVQWAFLLLLNFDKKYNIYPFLWDFFFSSYADKSEIKIIICTCKPDFCPQRTRLQFIMSSGVKGLFANYPTPY